MKGSAFFLVIFLPFLLWFSVAEGEGEDDLQTGFEGDFAQSFSLLDNSSLSPNSWERENHALTSFSLTPKVTASRWEFLVRGQVRASRSPLYAQRALWSSFLLLPPEGVVRKAVDLEKSKITSHGIHQWNVQRWHLSYQQEKWSGSLGRLYINYGLGEIVNPINPFTLPTGIQPGTPLVESNDGVEWRAFINEEWDITVYGIGEKNDPNRNGHFSLTEWVKLQHRPALGEWAAERNLELIYVLGKDRKRYHWGAQISSNFWDGLSFLQFVQEVPVSSLNVKESDRASLPQGKGSRESHLLLGFDRQMDSLWHLHGEYTKTWPKGPVSPLDLEIVPRHFVAVINEWELHPLVKFKSTLTWNLETRYLYTSQKFEISVLQNLEGDLTFQFPLYRDRERMTLQEKITPSQLGFSLRTYF